MKITKTIRYIGLCLMILSVLLMLYLYSFTFFKETGASTPDQFAVLEISAGTSKFPQTDFDVLFSKLKLASDSIRIDAGASAETQQKMIDAAIDGMKSDHVILFARKDACIPALTASLSNPGIASVILLSPDITGSEVMEIFGTHQPIVPVAIFDVDAQYSTSFYERLSGEDATLFPGLKDNGKISATVYISPDGNRYLSQWDLLGQSNTARSVLAFLPQVQIKIGGYISTYVFDPASENRTDSRAEVAAVQVMKILAAALLAAGLLMFFASIPKTVRDPDSGIPAEIASGTLSRARKRVFKLRAIIAVLFSAVLFILYLLNSGAAPVVLAAWPLVFYAVGAVFMFRFFPVHFANTHVPAKRIVFSGFIGFLLAAGVFLMIIMHSASVEKTFSGLYGILLLLYVSLLFVFSWIRLSADMQDSIESSRENGRTAKLRVLYQQVSLVFPYAIILIFLLITGRRILSLQCVFLLASLLAGIWIRHIFRRTSGTQWLAAIMFSVFYSLVAFG